MALSKAELYSAVESAFYESGWSCLRLSPKDEHPARYCMKYMRPTNGHATWTRGC